MYTHISKGITIGQVVARRIFRGLFGLPGLAADCIFALIYTGDHGSYFDYWEDFTFSYTDKTPTGFLQGHAGSIGDLIGYILGTALGGFMGGCLYFPDGVLRLLAGTYTRTANVILQATEAIGAHAFFADFRVYHNPVNYLHKTWNLATATLGLAVAAPLYVTGMLVEAFIPPLKTTLSSTLWKVGGFAGGIVGSGLGVLTWPLKHVADTCVSLFHSFRDKIRSASAFVYAKSNQTVFNGDDCFPKGAVHSQKFHQRVDKYKRSSTTEILFGAKIAVADIQEPLLRVLNVEDFNDPISLQRLVDPVIDRCGHTFSRGSILTWLNSHNTCPVSRQPLRERDLADNLLVASLLRARA